RVIALDITKLSNSVNAATVNNFFAGPEIERGGIRVAVRDANSDGRPDIVTGTAPDTPNRVRNFLPNNTIAEPFPKPDSEWAPDSGTNGVFVG
ncbi:MAG: hypothetical protein ACRCZF_21655, partial [Gemmataceae bacterium]